MPSKNELQRSTHFKRTLCRLGNILAIIPPHGYLTKSKTSGIQSYYKWYAILFVLLIIVGDGFAIYGRFKDCYPIFPTATLVLTDIAVNISTILANLSSVLVPSLWRVNSFRLFDETLETMENSVQKEDTTNTKKYKTFYIELMVGHLTIIFIFVYDAYVWINGLGFTVFRHYIFRDIQNYHLFITVMTMYNIGILMKYKFEELNNQLQIVTNLPQSKSHSIKTQLVKMEKYHSHITIRQISQKYEMELRQIGLYNKIFGWQILFLTFSTMMGILNSVDIITVYTFTGKKTHEEVFGYDLIILGLLWALWQVVLGILVAVSSTKVTNEAQKTADLCFSMLLMLDVTPVKNEDTVLRNELVLLSQLSMHRCPLFTAAGFFSIDYSLILAIFGSVTSYVIVLIQFNKY